MNDNDLIAKLQEEIRDSSWDIRAELQMIIAMQKGLAENDFLIFCNKIFGREYSRDIVSVDVKEDSKKHRFLQVQLSRTGLYDQLPEGLFFQLTKQNKNFGSAADMASSYKINKKREEQIRRFFLPFENDFFLQKMQVEDEEAMLLKGLQSEILNEYFIQFWDLPVSIPKQFIVPFIQLLPYAYKIVGNFDLTAQCLQELLQEEVKFNKKTKSESILRSMSPPALEDAVLGMDMVCGEQFEEETTLVEMEIGPLWNSQVADYLDGGSRFALMETFNRFFMPAGVDTVLSIQVASQRLNMVLDRWRSPVLGYSSVLG